MCLLPVAHRCIADAGALVDADRAGMEDELQAVAGGSAPEAASTPIRTGEVADQRRRRIGVAAHMVESPARSARVGRSMT
jgi:hypothetical protein